MTHKLKRTLRKFKRKLQNGNKKKKIEEEDVQNCKTKGKKLKEILSETMKKANVLSIKDNYTFCCGTKAIAATK